MKEFGLASPSLRVRAGLACVWRAHFLQVDCTLNAQLPPRNTSYPTSLHFNPYIPSHRMHPLTTHNHLANTHTLQIKSPAKSKTPASSSPRLRTSDWNSAFGTQPSFSGFISVGLCWGTWAF
jgi:hypothetical protein